MSDGTAPDAEVIAASLTDAERFAEVFTRHAGAVHRYLARRLGAQSADDLTAEVFLGAFRSRARYRPRSASALPWLFGIAANVAAQHRRDEARHWRLLAALPVVRDAADGELADADDRLDAEALGTAVVDALLSLPDVERQVVLLTAWEQLSPTEIAEALAIPAATVRTRLHRARAKVRRRLEHPPAAVSTIEELLRHD